MDLPLPRLRVARAAWALLIALSVFLAVGSPLAAAAAPRPEHTREQVLGAVLLDPKLGAVERAVGGVSQAVVPEVRGGRWVWALTYTEIEAPHRVVATARVDDETLAILRESVHIPPGSDVVLDARTAEKTADTAPELQEKFPAARRAHLTQSAQEKDGSWEVAYRDTGRTVAIVKVDSHTGKVRDVWTGHQVDWEMARGIPGAFGKSVNNPWIWIAMCLMFVVVMIDPRRLRSWRTLDILVLLSFSISQIFFNDGKIEMSVPLTYPPLIYLTVRAALLFFRGVPAATASQVQEHAIRRWWLPTWAITLIGLFALGLRYGLNYFTSNVIDVGYAGVAGAHDILIGKLPYGHMPANNPHGDTYGLLNYLLYVPATKLLGYSGHWDSLDAAHATTVAGDILTMLALGWIGYRWISGWRGAALLVAGWATFPYVTYATNSNVNDLLVSAFVVLALAALSRPLLRGVLIGCAGAIKFMPIVAIAALAHAGTRARLRQTLLTFAGAALVGLASVVALGVVHNGLHDFWHSTVGFQFDRDSPFSIWGLWDLTWGRHAAQILLVVGLVAVLWWPRTRDYRQVAAGMAAALLAVQLTFPHWFYLYIPWFIGPLLVVLVAQREDTRAQLVGVPADERTQGAGSEDAAAAPYTSQP